ncbi:hypothetical protein [Peristeroidobacter soli]|uniref:hypothetical protein n=1 Tax=Peristeroidobacter soli TaxID=2497877 RepID=UPI00101BE62B|nr:hypothetical protein [Peristeroidobacter soli]
MPAQVREMIARVSAYGIDMNNATNNASLKGAMNPEVTLVAITWPPSGRRLGLESFGRTR